MYRILIVDDEVITRKGLINHVNWDRLNVTKINTAVNGREAIEFIQNNQVDIILSDIRMPGMNGIEMGREIRKISPECQIVFLSGYSDKEYLKGAIDLEAVSYVEKPISIPEVEQALEKAISKIDIHRNNKRNIEKITKVIEENKNYLEAVFLQKLISGNIDIGQMKKYMESLGISFGSMNRFNVVLIKSADNSVDLECVAEKIKILSKVESVHYIKDLKYIVFLFAYREDEISDIEDTYKALTAYAKEQVELKINGSFGCTVSRLNNVSKSYGTAVILMQQHFFNDYGKINSYSRENIESGKVTIDDELIKDFEEAVTHFECEKAEELTEKLYSQLMNDNTILVSYVKGLYFRFIEIVLKAAQNSRTDNEKNSDTDIVSFIWEKLNSLDNITACRDYLNEELEEYFENTKDMANNSRIIIEVMEYVKANYMKPELCLNDIAENIYITPNYMNSLFKKKFGKTVGQYITDIRINAAKELIRDRKIKLSEVAERVGYNDGGYFTKVFRKNVGISPKDYRER